MCNSFGCTTAAGLFGLFGDTLADILCARGIRPVVKWVNDFFFIRVPRDTIPAYNHAREVNKHIIKNRGTLQQGGRLWYKGHSLSESGSEYFTEDLTFPLCDLHSHKGKHTIFHMTSRTSTTTPNHLESLGKHPRTSTFPTSPLSLVFFGTYPRKQYPYPLQKRKNISVPSLTGTIKNPHVQ